MKTTKGAIFFLTGILMIGPPAATYAADVDFVAYMDEEPATAEAGVRSDAQVPEESVTEIPEGELLEAEPSEEDFLDISSDDALNDWDDTTLEAPSETVTAEDLTTALLVEEAAEEADPILYTVGETSGMCGDQLTWELTGKSDYSKKLVISGTGEMYDFAYGNDAGETPWKDAQRYIQEIVIEEGVTGIGANAFSGCETLVRVSLPQGLLRIGDYAFNRCYKLTALDIPESVTEIGKSALAYCNKLRDLLLPPGLTEISDGMLQGCNMLTSLTLPAGITRIGGEAFATCLKLTEIELPDGLTEIDDNAFSFSGFTSLVIPDSVTQIGMYAFHYCPNLVELTLPEGMTSIPEGCFWSCEGLKELRLPPEVRTVGENAFNRCLSLEKIITPCSNPDLQNLLLTEAETIGLTIDNLTFETEHAFPNEGVIRTPASCGADGEMVYTCASCGEEKTEAIPATGAHIFTAYTEDYSRGAYISYCDNGCGAEKIGDEIPCTAAGTTEDGFAWAIYMDLLYIKGSGQMQDYDTAPAPWSVHPYTVCEVGEGVNSLGKNAFAGNTALTALVLPASLTELPPDALRGCTALQDATISGENSTFSVSDGLICSVDGSAVLLCLPGKSGIVNLPAGVTQIAAGAFSISEAVTDVRFADGTRNVVIENGAFADDASIKLAIPETVTEMDMDSPAGVVLQVAANSYAEYYALSHDLASESTEPSPEGVEDGDAHRRMAYMMLLKAVKASGGTLTYEQTEDNSVLPDIVDRDVIKINVAADEDRLTMSYEIKKDYVADRGKKSDSATRSITFQMNPAGVVADQFNFSCSRLGTAVPMNYYDMNGSVIIPPAELSDEGSYAYDFNIKPTLATSALDPYVELENEIANGLLFTALASVDPFLLLKADVQLSQLGFTSFYNEGMHQMTGGVKVEPTCLTDGYITKQYCKICGAVGSEEVTIPSPGHQRVTDAAIKATCTEDGISEGSHCERCGYVFKQQEVIPSTGHTIVTDAAVKATCTKDGLTEGNHCEVCGEIVTPQEIIHGGHKWNASIANQASCGVLGLKVYTCSACGETRQETIAPTGNHTQDSGAVTKQATVLQNGERTYKCKTCGKILKTETIDKLKPSMMINFTGTLPLTKGKTVKVVKISDLQEGDGIASISTTKPKVLSASFSGTTIILKGKKAGSAKFTVTLKSGLQKTCSVKVQKGTVKTKILTGLPVVQPMRKGEVYTLTTIVLPITSAQKATYSSSNKKVAKVSKKGVIKALKAGKTTITVKSGKKKYKFNVIVS